MKYDEYSYLWLPRPEQAIPPSLVNLYAGMGWIPQVKKNGTATLIFARGDEVIFKDRHGYDHDAWKPLPDHYAFFRGSDRWQVYAAELLHSKVPGIRHELYLFDVLVADGEHLVGKTTAERLAYLAGRFPGMRPEGFGAVRVAPLIQRAEPLLRYQVFEYRDQDALEKLAPEDEGFVFKNPKAPLVACLTARANSGWQVKCRRPHKNYSF